MSVANKELPVAQELDQVVSLLSILVADVKAKKSMVELATDVLPKLVAAIEGLDQVKDELASNKGAAFGTVGYRVGELVASLLG